MQKITPFLWYDGKAEEAANFYTSIFKNSKVLNVARYGDAGPGPKGSVMLVTFELDGQRFMALNGGPEYTFSPAISLFVDCETQAEVDELWEKLSAGGSEVQCGWLKDKFGVSWQIIPRALMELMGDKDPAKSQRVFKAMLQMTKIDVEGLKRAYRGVKTEGNEIEGDSMSQVRVLVGTRKGAFILTADGKRERWEVSGPHFAGWEIYHVKGSPADPNRLYVSQSSGWFGQIIQRSDDGGKTWLQPGTPPGEAPTPGPPKAASNKFVYDVSAETGKPLTTHQFYDGTQHPWEFKRVWHLEPSLTDPDAVYAGVEDAAIFRSTDGGENWKELPACAATGPGQSGSRVRAACACTLLFSIPALLLRRRSGSGSRFRRRARFAQTMAARPGSRSTAD